MALIRHGAIGQESSETNSTPLLLAVKLAKLRHLYKESPLGRRSSVNSDPYDVHSYDCWVSWKFLFYQFNHVKCSFSLFQMFYLISYKSEKYKFYIWTCFFLFFSLVFPFSFYIQLFWYVSRERNAMFIFTIIFLSIRQARSEKNFFFIYSFFLSFSSNNFFLISFILLSCTKKIPTW